MDFYGSTPLAYCVAFSLERALIKMLHASRREDMVGLIDLNDPKHACPLTGFLPLHVAVANSLTSMFNFLVDLPGLPIEFDNMRASTFALSMYGQMPQYAVHTPLQLGVRLGDKRIVQYILRTQSTCEWVWGPVSSWWFDLRGIDSVGDTGNDVMELVAKLDATTETQEMLLDSFIDGIFHTLFQQKFHRFGRTVFVVMRILDVGYLACLYVTGMILKSNPDILLRPDDDAVAAWAVTRAVASWLPYASLVCIVPMVEEDVRSAAGWWMTVRGARVRGSAEGRELLSNLSSDALQKWSDARLLMRWMGSHQMQHRLFGWLCTAAVMLAVIRFRGLSRLKANPPFWDQSSTPNSADQLSSCLVPLAIGTAMHTTAFFRAALAPFEKLGIFYNTVFKMLSSDVTYWMILFIIFLLNYGFVMYVTYPANFEDPSLTTAEPFEHFVSFNTALWALFELAFLGEPVTANVAAWRGFDTSSAKAQWASVSFVFFLIAYIIYIIMSLVLLLNLLIAMMGTTYEETLGNSTLEWRVGYAQRLLRLELQMSVLHRMGLVRLNCGTRHTDALTGTTRWVHSYKVYESNAEGGGARGRDRSSMFDEDVEREATIHEADDDGPGAGDADNATTGRLNVTAARGALIKVPTAALVKHKAISAFANRDRVSIRTVGLAVRAINHQPKDAVDSASLAPLEAPQRTTTAGGSGSSGSSGGGDGGGGGGGSGSNSGSGAGPGIGTVGGGESSDLPVDDIVEQLLEEVREGE